MYYAYPKYTKTNTSTARTNLNRQRKFRDDSHNCRVIMSTGHIAVYRFLRVKVTI